MDRRAEMGGNDTQEIVWGGFQPRSLQCHLAYGSLGQSGELKQH